MEQTAIFGPFLALMLLTLLVWIYMYVRRIGFIRRWRIDPRQLEIPGELARLTPAAVSNPSDNLKNLFELPVLFYALALLLFVTNRVDATYVAAAWAFVVFRGGAQPRSLHLQSSAWCGSAAISRPRCALWFMLLRAGADYLTPVGAACRCGVALATLLAAGGSMSRSIRYLLNALLCLLVGGHGVYWFAMGRAEFASDVRVGSWLRRPSSVSPARSGSTAARAAPRARARTCR